ncbi:MAG: type II toxin-antitoxin system HicA family toxin [Deltaproteobacteria bacterium]|nr:type II toxin-antitoxin system HicA family toxin [Deltaproteobacteria bacterium]
MTKLPTISGADLIKVLQKAGFEKVRQKGSHISLRKVTPGKTFKTIVPLHKTLAKGTLSDILKQSGLEKKDLVNYLGL